MEIVDGAIQLGIFHWPGMDVPQGWVTCLDVQTVNMEAASYGIVPVAQGHQT